jgi:hypothetical protein
MVPRGRNSVALKMNSVNNISLDFWQTNILIATAMHICRTNNEFRAEDKGNASAVTEGKDVLDFEDFEHSHFPAL